MKIMKIWSVSWHNPKHVTATFILTYLDIILLNSTSQRFSNPNLRYTVNRLLEMHAIIGAFAKLRKGTNSFVMSVRPSVCPSEWNNATPKWTDFHEI
jgi:hypothetical protein